MHIDVCAVGGATVCYTQHDPQNKATPGGGFCASCVFHSKRREDEDYGDVITAPSITRHSITRHSITRQRGGGRQSITPHVSIVLKKKRRFAFTGVHLFPALEMKGTRPRGGVYTNIYMYIYMHIYKGSPGGYIDEAAYSSSAALPSASTLQQTTRHWSTVCVVVSGCGCD